MKLLPETRSGKGIYVLFVLGLLGWVARVFSTPDWIQWVLFVPFLVLGIWVILLLLKSEEPR